MPTVEVPRMIRQIGVSIVGVGAMGEIHLQAYTRHPLARIVGVFDVDERRTREIAARYGVKAFASTEELLAAKDNEAVSICTSDQFHVAPALAALKAGKHVLLEKPIATTLADADAIAQAAASVPGKLLLGHIVRFDPRYARLKELAAAGELGELESIFARRLNTVDAQNTLKGRVSVLSFLGVHDFDFMRWLAASEAISVHTESVSRLMASRGYSVEDTTFTLLRFANGVIGCAEIGWLLPASHPRRADFKVEAIGTRGIVSIDLESQGLEVCTDHSAFQRPGFGHSIDAEIAHFLGCILDDKEPLVGARDGRAALEISLAAQLSASGRGIVKLPLPVA